MSIYFSLYKDLLLENKMFKSLDDCKSHLKEFFAQKDKMFWEDGIMKLPLKEKKKAEDSKTKQ